MNNKPRWLWILSGIFIWFTAAVYGMLQLLSYEFQPGQPARAPLKLPGLQGIGPSGNRPTLLVVIHPRCPCSQATLEELRQVLGRNPGRSQAYCLFVWPESQSPAWVHSSNWKLAREIPDLRLLPDPGGRLANLLGARTSGQTYLYGADGRLLFSGGLTGSRGHAGDNSGLALLESTLRNPAGGRRRVNESPVFGCAAAPRKEPCLERSCCQKN